MNWDILTRSLRYLIDHSPSIVNKYLLRAYSVSSTGDMEMNKSQFLSLATS